MALRKSRIRILLALAIVGFVVPNAFVIAYTVQEGFAIGDYLAEWFDTLPNAQLSIDLGLVSLSFLLWAGWDAARVGVKRWWWAIVGTFTVGICFGVPLYLWLRERRLGSTADEKQAVPSSAPA